MAETDTASLIYHFHDSVKLRYTDANGKILDSLGVHLYISSQAAFLPLQAFEELDKRSDILCSTDLECVVDGEVRYPADVLRNSILYLLVYLGSAFAALEPFLSLLLLEPSLDASFDQDILSCNVLLVLEVGSEQLLDDAGLHLRTFGFSELDQAMRVSGIASVAAVFEVDALSVANLRESHLHHSGTFFAEFRLITLLLVDALGCGRIQVEGEPVGRKGIAGTRMFLLVCCNALFQSLLAYIAPGCFPLAKLRVRAEAFWDSRHTVSDTTLMLKFVILRRLALKATLKISWKTFRVCSAVCR